MDQKQLIGHKKAQETILKLIAENKLPHALLLHGAEGIGKAVFAKTLAYMLICGNNPAVAKNRFSVNYNSENFNRIQAGSLDEFKLIEPIDGKKSISVEQIRDNLANLSLTSDHKRVIIINTADQLNNNSANAILKTLEEPPLNTLLILISNSPAKLLPTINSRCRKIKLDNLAIHEVEQILEQENISFNQQALDFCNGSVSKAIEFLTDGQLILKYLEEFFENPNIMAIDVINIAERLSDKRLKESLVYSQLKDIIYAATKNCLDINNNLSELKCIKSITKNYSSETLINIYHKILETEKMRNAINIGQTNCLENIFKEFITDL